MSRRSKRRRHSSPNRKRLENISKRRLEMPQVPSEMELEKRGRPGNRVNLSDKQITNVDELKPGFKFFLVEKGKPNKYPAIIEGNVFVKNNTLYVKALVFNGHNSLGKSKKLRLCEYSVVELPSGGYAHTKWFEFT